MGTSAGVRARRPVEIYHAFRLQRDGRYGGTGWLLCTCYAGFRATLSRFRLSRFTLRRLWLRYWSRSRHGFRRARRGRLDVGCGLGQAALPIRIDIFALGHTFQAQPQAPLVRFDADDTERDQLPFPDDFLGMRDMAVGQL